MPIARPRSVTRILLATTGVIALLGVAAPQPPEGPRKPARAQRIAAERHDVSKPLRDIPAIKSGAHHEPSEREMRFERHIHKLHKTPDTLVQDYATPTLIPSPATSFEGLGNVDGVLPPDTNGDVGPNHYVQSVNVSFAVYGKGTPSTPPVLLYGPAAASTLWTGFGGPCETRNDGDAVVMYDHLADRWVVSQLSLPNLFFGIAFAPFYQCIAVSTTPDPTGAYYRYQFPFNKLNDYPKLGVWPDGYYMGINQYAAISLQFAGQGVIAFDRQKMLAGLPATMQYMDLGSVDINLGGMLPADLDGTPPPAGSPAYFVQVDDDAWGYSTDRLQLWRFAVNWSDPAASTFTGPSVLSVAPFDSDLCSYARTCIPQPGTAAKVDAMADRLMYRLQYRNFGTHESLVVNHTVDADGTDHAGIRWYEIRDPRTTPTVYQQGTYAPDTNHRWMGSAALDASGNMALGFSVSGTATAPSIRYTGRLATDPPGAMTQGEADIVIGSGSQTHESGRWGDYSMMAVDPIDGCTFWYTQQYYGATSVQGWQTRVGSFSFPSCSNASALPRITITATTPVANEAGPVSGLITVSRTGDTASPLSVSFAISGTATPNVDYVALPSTVTIPAGAASVGIPVTPIDDPFSEPTESVTLTLNPSAAYVAGSPSQGAVSIVSDDLPPDLLVAVLTTPALAVPGGAMTISDTTRNQGGAAAASLTGFYLSPNVLLDAQDAFLGTRSIPALVPGAVNTGSVNVTVPANTATGTYYVLARADNAGTITESQELNNIKFSTAIRVGPDLVVSTFTPPATAGAGATISLTDTTKNDGSVSTEPSRTAFYLSANALLDAGDTMLGSRAVPILPAGGTSTGSTPVQIPAGTATGTYFLFAKADLNSDVHESSETNNSSFAVAIRVGPDLTVSAINVSPTSVGAGSTITVNETTKNIGGGAAPASTTHYYLSTNFAFDPGDLLVGSRPVPALAAGSSSAASTLLTLPAGTTPGNYYLISVADGTATVVETSEVNNTLFGILRVTGSLRP